MMERALRVATWIAAGLLLAGLLLWMAGVAAGDPVMHAGLLLLIATPIARVVIALIDFLVLRDWRFAMLTGVVLLSLAYPIVRFFLSFQR